MRIARVLYTVFALASLTLAACGQGMARTRLYTVPDPESTGGVTGHVTQPGTPLEQILAIPTALPENVYQGEISGPKRDHFQFKGLPAGKYDLIAVFESAWYEGLQLNREPSSLTKEDVAKIDASIQKAEPFFTKKIIHRVEGETGRGNCARCICTFVREKASDLMMTQFEGQFKRDDFRRTFKLVMLKDVGPGWQIVRARDLYPVWVNPKRSLPEHHFSAALSQIRVADEMKDAGDLDLSH